MRIREFGVTGRIITAEDIRNDGQLSGEIIGMIADYYQQSYTFMSRKLQQWRNYYENYTNPKTFYSDFLKIHYCLQQMQVFKSLYYEADFEVKLTSQRGDGDYAYKMERLAQFDYDVMDRRKKEWQLLDHVGFYGLGIEREWYYDKRLDVPVYRVHNPEGYLPDIYGNVIDNNFLYHGFVMRTTLNELYGANKGSGGKYFNLEQLSTMGLYEYATNEYLKKNVRLLSMYEDYYRALRISDWYLELNGRKYQCSVGNNNSLMIKWDVVPALTKDERDDPYLVKYPVNITNMIPIDGDVCGIGLLELTLDKQNSINRIMNMGMLKEERNVGFDNIFVDTNIVQNVDLLSKRPALGPNYIPVRTINGQPLTNSPLFAATEPGVTQSEMSILDRIQSFGNQETGFTDQVRGLQGGTDTLGQSKIQMVNASVVFGLTQDVLTWGVKGFWNNIYYRSLVHNLSDGKKKLAVIDNGMGTNSTTITLEAPEIQSEKDAKITVVSKKDYTENNKQLLAYMAAREQIVMQDPNIPQVSKNIFRRTMDELNGVTRERVFINTPLSPDERQAKLYVAMINADKEPESLFKPGMDLPTYYIYIGTCNNSKLKERAMNQLVDEMIKQGMNVPQENPANLQGVSNAMGSQMTGALINSTMGQQGNLPTLQSFKQGQPAG